MGLRAGRLRRIKHRVLRDAIEENLDTIRGTPPRSVRRGYRLLAIWSRRTALVILPLTILGSSYVISKETAPASANVTSRTVRPISRFAFPSEPVQRRLPPTFPAPQPIDSNVFPLAVRRVVLDAGHGGNDPGTLGAFQLYEKHVTLDIERRLEALLARDGFEVVVTRTGDHTVPLKERARMANESRGDIFVSIHVNSMRNPNSRGVETYYLGPTKDPVLERLAAAENQSSGYSLSDYRALLDRVYADARREESRTLAEVVQRELHQGLGTLAGGLENWGVRRAPFIVLVATDMPAILAEVSCLSNPKDAELLRNEGYRQKIAEALYRGIRSYATAHETPGKKGI